MATFVLVHGAIVSAYSWAPVRPLLRAAGHEVFCPTLTGQGERVHLSSSSVDLETHVTDVLNVLVYEELTGVVLVGHSYGGMVVTGVADRTPECVARLVYLDAAVPRDGQSVLDALSPAARADRQARMDAAPDDWRFPLNPGASWRAARQPKKTYTQPLRFVSDGGASLPRTYIRCTEGKNANDDLEPTLRRVREEPGWVYRELPCSHMAQTEMPNELAALLLEAATGL